MPWLKIDCPMKSTRRQLCLELLDALDLRLGQDTYRRRYGNLREAEPTGMLLDVQLLCQIHAVGILVVDEVQNLANSPEGPETMMSFLVALVNKCGVPVLAVGTMKASKVIGRDFRQARRSSGLHATSWVRSGPADPDWRSLVGDLWTYQWTAERTELTEELRDALYDASQGIVDVLVKLFVLVQCRVILLGQVPVASMVGSDDPLWVGGRRREAITPAIIAEVARDDMQPIQPMIRALRDGREDVFEQWHDLSGFHGHVAPVLGSTLGRTAEDYRRSVAASAAVTGAMTDAPADPLAPVRAFLAASGHPADVVAETLRLAVEAEPDGDTSTVLRAAGEIIAGARPVPVPAAPATAPVAPAPRLRRAAGAAKAAPAPFSDRDLRAIAASARAAGRSAHAGLVEAGVVVPAQEAWVA